MKDALCPALELLAVVPGAVLCLLPVKEYLRIRSPWKVCGIFMLLVLWALWGAGCAPGINGTAI